MRQAKEEEQADIEEFDEDTMEKDDTVRFVNFYFMKIDKYIKMV